MLKITWQNVKTFKLFHYMKYDKSKDEVSTAYPLTHHRVICHVQEFSNVEIGPTETYMNISGV